MMVTWCFFEGAPRVAIVELKLRATILAVVVMRRFDICRECATENDPLELNRGVLYKTFLVIL